MQLLKEHKEEIYATEGTGNMNKYQTRVVSTANKVNLELPDAEPQLKMNYKNNKQYILKFLRG